MASVPQTNRLPLPTHADLSKLWLMPTTGTKLYTYRQNEWKAVYAELFSDEEKKKILEAFDASLEATGFTPEQTWGKRIEDRGESDYVFGAGAGGAYTCQGDVGSGF